MKVSGLTQLRLFPGTQPIQGGLVCLLPFEEVQRLPLATRYIRSLYSVFSGGFAYTEAENFFGIVATLVVGFIYGGLAGVLSTIMMTQNAGEQQGSSFPSRKFSVPPGGSS